MCVRCGVGGGRRAVFKGGGGDLRNVDKNERSRGRPLLPGHGSFSTSKVGGWRLAAVGAWRLVLGGGWQLAVGGWRLVVPEGCPLPKKKKTWLLKDSPGGLGGALLSKVSGFTSVP